ncbi:DUF308 domain-containing protein [Streptomyces sp. NPDC006326]|uniref:DUF308 domain-containing protein n=1 Tax=Streptomyces sp. NPDC006326 TaxID=3156752 RepID=UPI0033A8BC0C
MANTPEVTVGAPDDLGFRKVLINGKCVGKARSPRQLRKILSRADPTVGHHVDWRGADSTVWPDQPGWRRTQCAFMVFGLLATAWPLFQIGIADSGDALTYGGRIAGFTFLVAGLLEVIAAAAAVDYWHERRWRYSGVTVLVGVVIALLCSISLLLLQIGERFTRYTLIGMSLALWSGVALLELIECRAWKGLRIPRKIAIGALVSTLLAGANLAYSQIYVPYVKTPLIQSGADFKESSWRRGGAQMYVTVHLYVKNAGQVPVYILDSIYWIHGAPASDMSDKKRPPDKLIYYGDFVSPVGRVLDPGDVIAQDVVVEIKNPERLNYEAVKAQTEVYVIRKDRMKLGADYGRSAVKGPELQKELEEGDPVGAQVRYRSEMSNSSEILNMVRGRQRITVWRVASGPRPTIIVDVLPPGERITFHRDEPYANEKASKRYGLTQVRGSTAQTPYPELLEKAR